MAQKKTGVLPCYENQFQIDTAASGAETNPGFLDSQKQGNDKQRRNDGRA